MKASCVIQTILAIALVTFSCATSKAIDPTTGQFVFNIVPIVVPVDMVIGYAYTLDPNEVFEVRGDIEYNLPGGGNELQQFMRGAPATGGFDNLKGVPNFVIQPTFMEQPNAISDVRALTSGSAQSGDIFEVTFMLETPTTLADTAPLIRFFSNSASTSHIIDFENEADCIEFDVVSSGPSNCLTSIPGPTTCSLLLLGAVCFGLRIRRGQRRT